MAFPGQDGGLLWRVGRLSLSAGGFSLWSGGSGDRGGGLLWWVSGLSLRADRLKRKVATIGDRATAFVGRVVPCSGKLAGLIFESIG